MHLILSMVLLGFVVGSPRTGTTDKKRQDGSVDPGVADDCTFYDTANNVGENCLYFEHSWGISHADFVLWNPSVKDDCSGLVVGHSYCVEVNYGVPRPTTVRTTRTSTQVSSTKMSTVSPIIPTPTDSGIPLDCNRYHKVIPGDTCESIVSLYTVDLGQFYAWNPALQSSCQFLERDYYYCVGSSTTPDPTVTGTRTPGTTPTSPTPGGPSPTEPGIAPDCNQYHKVVSGDDCEGIVSQYGTFSLPQFYAWNPALQSSCAFLKRDFYYCIGVSSLAQPSSIQTPVPSSTTPSPVESGIVANCNRYHLVAAGDDCNGIVLLYGTFSLPQFYAWNPALQSSCSHLKQDVYYCVGVPGTPSTITSRQSSTSACKTAPTPTQPGSSCSCRKWHKVTSDCLCDCIISRYGITANDFYSWNPSVGRDCSKLFLDTFVCVSM